MAMINYEIDIRYLEWKCTKNPDKNCDEAMTRNRIDFYVSNIIRWIILISTICAVISLFCGQYFKSTCLKHQQDKKTQSTNLINIYKFYSDNKQNVDKNDKKKSIFSSSHFLNFWFILELIVLLICPLPHYEYFVEIDYIIKEPNH